MPDLLQEWATETFAHHITNWAQNQLPSNHTCTTPFTLQRLRFWSAVFRAESTNGPLWCKANNPGQQFEAAFVAHISRTSAATHSTCPLATDPDRGLLLYPDYGPTMRAQADPNTALSGPAEALALVPATAAFQHQTANHKTALLNTGLSVITPEASPELIADRLAWHVALPNTNPQHLSVASARQLTELLPDFAADMAILAQSGVPYTVQPNDAHGNNAFPDPTAPHGVRLHDFGDAFWSHPFAVLDSLLATAGQNPLVNKNAPALNTNPIVTTYLEHWPQATVELVRPALRLGRLLRYEAWRRLILPVPYQNPDYQVPAISTHLTTALTG